MSSSPARDRSRLASVLEEQREAARDYLSAAARAFEERFAELSARLEEELRTEVEAARRQASEEFNRVARRLAQHRNAGEWESALVEAAERFCTRAALLRLEQDTVLCAGASAPLARAPAVAQVVQTRDTLVALASAGELSEAIAAKLQARGGRCTLVPVSARDRVAAVIYAEGDTDLNALETLAALAGMALETHAGRRPPSPLMTIAGQRGEVEVPLDWAQLTRAEQQAHLRAQRFARVRVAEMRLYKAGAVRAGRAGGTLYRELRDEIDSAREAYRGEFLEQPSMVDYFHLELVRTLANDDVRALGEEYPGPLV